jgi:3-methyladenine DNA glycosylase Tag
MPRFEMNLTIAVVHEENIDSIMPNDPIVKKEYKIISFVKDSYNEKEIVKQIKKIVNYYTDKIEGEVLFSLAMAEVNGNNIILSSLNSDWDFTVEDVLKSLNLDFLTSVPEGTTMH